MKNLLKITFFAAIFFMLHGNIFSQEKYAVIITGDYAAPGSWAEANGEGRQALEEFWNDTYLMWEMLLEKGYSEDNIFVLFANNEDYNPFWIDERYTAGYKKDDDDLPLYSKVSDYRASKEKVLKVLTGMANGLDPDTPQLTEDDFLYLYTFGHGNNVTLYPEDGNEVIRTYLKLIDYDEELYWDSENSLTDIELANLLGNINANKKVVIMQQ